MTFEYQIDEDVYVACQVLYHKAKGTWETTRLRAAGWGLFGIATIIVACFAPAMDWIPFLLAMNGAIWAYAGTKAFFPQRQFRKCFAATNLRDKKFTAELNSERLKVSGDYASWDVQWPSITLRLEDEHVFASYSEETGAIYMFGKKQLSNVQQEQVRHLCGISAK